MFPDDLSYFCGFLIKLSYLAYFLFVCLGKFVFILSF